MPALLEQEPSLKMLSVNNVAGESLMPNTLVVNFAGDDYGDEEEVPFGYHNNPNKENTGVPEVFYQAFEYDAPALAEQVTGKLDISSQESPHIIIFSSDDDYGEAPSELVDVHMQIQAVAYTQESAQRAISLQHTNPEDVLHTETVLDRFKKLREEMVSDEKAQEGFLAKLKQELEEKKQEAPEVFSQFVQEIRESAAALAALCCPPDNPAAVGSFMWSLNELLEEVTAPWHAHSESDEEECTCKNQGKCEVCQKSKRRKLSQRKQ